MPAEYRAQPSLFTRRGVCCNLLPGFVVFCGKGGLVFIADLKESKKRVRVRVRVRLRLRVTTRFNN